MRIRARAVFRPMLLLFVGAVLLVPDASAGQVTITFGGTVTGTGTGISFPPNVQVGQSISGYFTYNVPASGTNGTYNFAGTNQSLIFSIPILGNTSTFSGQNSNVAPKNTYTVKIVDTGVKGATFDVAADLINAAGKTGVTCDILFTSSTYTGVALPASSAAFSAAFAKTTAKFNWDPGGLGIAADINIINGEAVPEPSSLVLAVIGMAACTVGSVVVSRRRKAAKVLESDRSGEPICAVELDRVFEQLRRFPRVVGGAAPRRTWCRFVRQPTAL